MEVSCEFKNVSHMAFMCSTFDAPKQQRKYTNNSDHFDFS